ncbi:hypothetical protein BU26DRAFT_519226, partial [Trematosphaeria pertusa]
MQYPLYQRPRESLFTPLNNARTTPHISASTPLHCTQSSKQNPKTHLIIHMLVALRLVAQLGMVLANVLAVPAAAALVLVPVVHDLRPVAVRVRVVLARVRLAAHGERGAGLDCSGLEGHGGAGRI